MYKELLEMGAHKLNTLPFEEFTPEERIRIDPSLYMNIPEAIKTYWEVIQNKDTWLLIRASRFDDELASVSSGFIAINIGKSSEQPTALAVSSAVQNRLDFSDDKYKGICVVSDLLVEPRFRQDAQNPSLRERFRVWYHKPYEVWKTAYIIND